MKWLHRLPAEIASAVELNADERPLAWTTDSAGRHIVATESDLILQRTPPRYARIGWESIDRATYDGGQLWLTLVPDRDENAAQLQIPLGDETKLAVVIRDRVTSSIVLNQHVAIDNQKGLRVVARRRAGDPILRWGYVIDDGVELTKELQQHANNLLEQVRVESGME